MAIVYTFVGHGTHLLDIDGHKIIVDPFLTDNPMTNLSPDTLAVNTILVSHGHGDHILDAMPLAKRTGAKVIANHEIVGWFRKHGLPDKQLHGQHIGGGFKHEFGYVKLTIAMHGSQLPDGSYGGNPVGFLITTPGGKKIYFACDTGLFASMKLYGEEGLDLAVLPIGDNYTMGPDDALRAVKMLMPKQVVPCHYNTWPLLAQDAQAWKARVEAETSTKVAVLAPGASLTV